MFSPAPDDIDTDSDYAYSLCIQTLMEYDTEPGDQRAVYGYGNQRLNYYNEEDDIYPYNAEYTDGVTGNKYLRARYYRPGTGNFLTMDSETGDL